MHCSAEQSRRVTCDCQPYLPGNWRATGVSADCAHDVAWHARARTRGIRGLVTAAAVAVFALALLTRERGLLVFAAVFLAEELYETGVLVLILRASEEAGPARATP